MELNILKEKIINIEEELITLNEFILDNPELGNQEYKASKAHTDLLGRYGFEIERPYLNMDTAFKAEYDSGKAGPTIAYLAEYDALPGIGHGCGHNILGTVSTGAGLVLKDLIDDTGGRVIVFGTPAEESYAGKVEMVNKGAFDDVDVAMLVHASSNHYKSGKSLALKAIKFTYRGKTSHASASPEEGINALDAAINTFNNINAMREHLKKDARIHGIISNGGEAANIVPDLAAANFYIRAETKSYLNQLEGKLMNAAKGASLAAGTSLETSYYETPCLNLITNQKLSETYIKNIRKMGVDEIYDNDEATGSTDAGDVSHVCPTIQPYFAITEDELTGHSREFRDATKSEYAYQEMKKAIGALVLTALDIIEDPGLLQEIKREFANRYK
ncbi:M20 family metallopeptidase [Halanaerobiaceae bacterium Z-7014]|uniref:Peptidase M20 domain-containing protein 2 n=1 Tax=Halonatronomonas betaini TaxID=2778430 RepID=A0A931ANV5_9FIRM|nr:M20 family metallopeptidase [Halonatronomonas betaini]MBF8435767.1 M20 family metallopeptidase [Halonatronomonas betaini]